MFCTGGKKNCFALVAKKKAHCKIKQQRMVAIICNDLFALIAQGTRISINLNVAFIHFNQM